MILSIPRRVLKHSTIMMLLEVHSNEQIWDEFLYELMQKYFVFRSFGENRNAAGVALLLPRLCWQLFENDFDIHNLIPGRVLGVAFVDEEQTFVAWAVHFHELEDDLPRA